MWHSSKLPADWKAELSFSSEGMSEFGLSLWTKAASTVVANTTVSSVSDLAACDPFTGNAAVVSSGIISAWRSSGPAAMVAATTAAFLGEVEAWLDRFAAVISRD